MLCHPAHYCGLAPGPVSQILSSSRASTTIDRADSLILYGGHWIPFGYASLPPKKRFKDVLQTFAHVDKVEAVTL